MELYLCDLCDEAVTGLLWAASGSWLCPRCWRSLNPFEVSPVLGEILLIEAPAAASGQSLVLEGMNDHECRAHGYPIPRKAPAAR